MIAGGKLWWEASLKSVKAAKIFHESDKLGFGVCGKWSPTTIIDQGIIKDIYTLAHEVVTRIDNIGILNKGPKSSSDPKTNFKAKKTSKESMSEGPPGMRTYW